MKGRSWSLARYACYFFHAQLANLGQTIVQEALYDSRDVLHVLFGLCNPLLLSDLSCNPLLLAIYLQSVKGTVPAGSGV